MDLAGQALSAMAPARLESGNGRSTFAVNRRNNPERDVPKRRAEGTIKGPSDHDLPVAENLLDRQFDPAAPKAVT